MHEIYSINPAEKIPNLPDHAWERGLNEHTNGLIRQYLPKKSEFTNVSKDDEVPIEGKLL